jgi:hypothetical protein
MTTTQGPEPQRWTERPDGERSVEAVLGAALRRARAATTPPEAVYARVQRVPGRRAPAVRPYRWRVAMVTVAALLAVAGSVGAARQPLRRWAVRHRFISPPPVAAAREAAVRAPRTPAAREPEAPPIVAPPALAEALAAGTAPPPPVLAPLAVPTAVSSDVPSPAAEEARLLAGAFRALRAQARADAALAALDDYDRRFPAGLLRGEARLARVEALLALGAPADALALLDAWEAAGVELPRRARVARGELRAEGGRCAEAALDFNVVLAGAESDEAGGRALHGLASCAHLAGDDATAVAALTRYLEGHPRGPQAAAAREALARLRTRPQAP